MCLNLTANAEKQIATEDIVCYKRVITEQELTISQYAGKLFTGIIKDIECEGKIQIIGTVYFCTDNPNLNGNNCGNKLGYEYSWAFDYYVKKIMVDGVDIMVPIKDSIFTTPYRGATVKLGETYISELIRTQLDTIEIGLHSFTTYYSAKYDGFGVVVKCIIPKGAEYYEGEFFGDKSYASNQLKYVEVIDDESYASNQLKYVEVVEE